MKKPFNIHLLTENELRKLIGLHTTLIANQQEQIDGMRDRLVAVEKMSTTDRLKEVRLL